MKLVILDRDGVLNEESAGFIKSVAEWKPIAGSLEAVARLSNAGFRIYIASNQSGIGRGLHTLDAALRVNARMEELLALPQPIFADICIAPEAPDQPSRYRKPSPRFILESIKRHALDPAHCWMVGDREADIQAGLNAKIKTAAVCTGKLDAAGWTALGLQAPVFENFAAFAETLT